MPAVSVSTPPTLPGTKPFAYADWWRCLFEASEDAQLVCSSDGVICQANARAVQWLGLERGFIQTRQRLQQSLTGATASKVAVLLGREAGAQTTLSSVTLMSEGQMSMIADLQGTPLGDGYSLVTIKDATRRWRMESHVQRLMTAVDATQDVVFMTDADFRLIFANPAFQMVTGYSIEDALGRTADFLRDPGEQEKIQAYLARVKGGYDWHGELLNLRSDGTTFPVAASIAPIFDKHDQLLGYASFERDITQHRQLQDELRRERDHAHSIIDSLDSAVYTLDHQFKLCHINDGWKKMPAQHGWLHLNHPPQAGHNLLDYVPDPAKRVDLQRLFENVLSTGTVQETRATTTTGHHWLIKVAPWRQGDTIVGLLYVVTDQSKFHDLQRQLYQAQKMETIGALAAGVAHDFNNLLQAIRGNAALLLIRENLGDPVRQTVQQIDQAAERAADITRQLLSFSRASDEKLAVLDFNQITCDAVQLFQRSLSNIIEIRLQPSSVPVCARIDNTRAQQLLLNLFVNAQDAMPKGGTLTIATEKTRLTGAQAEKHQLAEGADFLHCRVSDTGTGIPPEVMPRIFDAFFTTKEKGKGTGLGLAIATSVINQGGGFMEVETELGRGTTFHIYLPMVLGEAPVAQAERKARFRKGTGRVLVVDDLELVLDFTEQFLVAAGYEVMVAHNPAEAMVVLENQEKPVDLLFTDFNMGETNGLQLINQVAERWPKMRFILASGYLQDEERHAIQSQFGVRILDKPFNVRDAANMIAEMLSPQPA